MELWQMDIVGDVRLADGGEAKIVSGVDDHSRFCVSAQVVARATARPTWDALALAMRRHGVPREILTDIQAGWCPSEIRVSAGRRHEACGDRRPLVVVADRLEHALA
jgi:hypothetical protein